VGKRLVAIVRAELSLSSTPMFGRKRELSAVRQLLLSGQHRLVTLTGAGAAGKSRLAGAATDTLSATFGDVLLALGVGGWILASVSGTPDAVGKYRQVVI
jgi:hypothetical protein